MRLMKGSKVEVLSKREVPSGSWLCGEILYGNGHNYDVKYDRTSGKGKEIVERVSRKLIRPRPLTLGGTKDWVVGEIAEVFDHHSWKIAEVSKVVGGDHFFVRLLGSSREFRVHKSDLRVRLSWKDNQWTIIGKDSRSCEDREAKELSPVRYHPKPSCKVMKVRVGGNPLQELNVHNRGVKRSKFCSSDAETLVGVGQKVRVIEEGRRQGPVLALRTPFLEKVDVVDSPKSMLGDNFMHASFKNGVNGFSEMGMARGTQDADVRCFVPMRLKPVDAESITNSVASCSSSNHESPCMSPCHFTAYPSLELDCHSDDAASSCGREYGDDSSISRKGALTTEVHKLELHAYRSTLGALFASGPLSWEQEAMVTNLRLMLHISNDEHLLELRHLVSAERLKLEACTPCFQRPKDGRATCEHMMHFVMSSVTAEPCKRSALKFLTF